MGLEGLTGLADERGKTPKVSLDGCYDEFDGDNESPKLAVEKISGGVGEGLGVAGGRHKIILFCFIKEIHSRKENKTLSNHD